MKVKKQHIFIALSVIIMIVIFIFSNQNSGTSYGVSEIVANFLRKFKINNILPSINGSFNYTIRKIAHITLYFLLGLMISCSTRFYLNQKQIKHKSLINFAISSVICVVYACLDELHQTFVNGRTGKLSDVGYDAIGFISAIFLVIIVSKSLDKQSNK